jgi:hypothetical protein
MIKPGVILKTLLFQPQLESGLNLEKPSSDSKRERGSRTPEVQKTAKTCVEPLFVMDSHSLIQSAIL